MNDYLTNNNRYSYQGQLYMSPDASGNLAYDPAKGFELDTIRHNSAGNYWDAVTRTGIKQQHAVSTDDPVNMRIEKDEMPSGMRRGIGTDQLRQPCIAGITAVFVVPAHQINLPHVEGLIADVNVCACARVEK